MKVTKENRFSNQKKLLESIGFRKPDYVDGMFRILEISDDVELWFGFEEDSGNIFLMEHTFLHFVKLSNLSTFKQIIKGIFEDYDECLENEKRSLIETATYPDKNDESNIKPQQLVKVMKSIGSDSYCDNTVFCYQLCDMTSLEFTFFDSSKELLVVEEKFLWGSDLIEDDDKFLAIATDLVTKWKQDRTEKLNEYIFNQIDRSIKQEIKKNKEKRENI